VNILITSGGTREYIDDVRVLTNISSGQLGADIADEAMHRGHTVTYIHGTGSVQPAAADWYQSVPASGGVLYGKGRGHNTRWEARTTADLMRLMEQHVPTVSAVVHAMAVSDFTFGVGRHRNDREAAVKLKSSDAEGFIEFMRATIRPTPKVLRYIKDWNPRVYLVSFKFEVGLSQAELFQRAWASASAAEADAVFANDKVEMDRVQRHVGYLLRPNLDPLRAVGKPAIARAILDAIEGGRPAAEPA